MQQQTLDLILPANYPFCNPPSTLQQLPSHDVAVVIKPIPVEDFNSSLWHSAMLPSLQPKSQIPMQD